jgi:hypothetical protein
MFNLFRKKEMTLSERLIRLEKDMKKEDKRAMKRMAKSIKKLDKAMTNGLKKAGKILEV